VLGLALLSLVGAAGASAPFKSPDGSFTLRLSYGRVKGYDEDGKQVAPFTEIRGLYVRGDEHGQKPPYKFPESWSKARASVKMTTPYNFVTTNDIVGGNSGSPVINAKGELVGLIFDGNIQSLPGYFVYDGAVNRAVSVDGLYYRFCRAYDLAGQHRPVRAAPAARTVWQRATRPRRPLRVRSRSERLIWWVVLTTESGPPPIARSCLLCAISGRRSDPSAL